MKILFPADGSSFTKKALGFLVTHPELAGGDSEVAVLHVQPPMPPRVKTLVGASAVNGYHADEARKVLAPIERFLKRHDIAFTARWVIGLPAPEIIKASKAGKAHLIVMGTQGHGILGRALMGSVAQNVVTQCDIPVLLVK